MAQITIGLGPDNSINSNKNISNLVYDSLALYYDASRTYSYDGTTAVFTDLSGNGRDATFYNLITSTYTDNSPSAPFWSNEGGGSFLMNGGYFGKIPTWSLGSQSSISAWIKTSSTSTVAILGHCNGGPVHANWSIANGRMEYHYYYNGWYYSYGTATNVNSNTWKFITWTLSGTTLKTYINGSLDSTATLVGPMTSSMGSLGSKWGPCMSDSYGAGTDGMSAGFNGYMAMVMAHSKTLSVSEILQNYNNTKFRFGL